jgi:hypothetical protein
MSGTSGLQQSIPYGDRPMGNVQAGGVYMTTEMYQYLERLVRAINQLDTRITALEKKETTSP